MVNLDAPGRLNLHSNYIEHINTLFLCTANTYIQSHKSNLKVIIAFHHRFRLLRGQHQVLFLQTPKHGIKMQSAVSSSSLIILKNITLHGHHAII